MNLMDDGYFHINLRSSFFLDIASDDGCDDALNTKLFSKENCLKF